MVSASRTPTGVCPPAVVVVSSSAGIIGACADPLPDVTVHVFPVVSPLDGTFCALPSAVARHWDAVVSAEYEGFQRLGYHYAAWRFAFAIVHRRQV